MNVKERLDFSCAIFDRLGGADCECPAYACPSWLNGRVGSAVLRDNAGNIAPGDAYVLNNPYNGGTHLPDITVVDAGI